MQFSVVIPAYNAAAHLERCVASVVAQQGAAPAEILVIDDGSTDDTPAIAARLAAAHPNLRALRTERNGGPGVARNLGVENAAGDWILFLDSDDSLCAGALARLESFLAGAGKGLDAVGYNWRFEDKPDGTGARTDQLHLGSSHEELIRRYLMLQMDGSVIYTAVRRSLLRDKQLRFEPGYHEDVDYIFKIYWHARAVGFLDAVLYAKSQRAGSIVNTVSIRHLEGFVRAWEEIGRFLFAQPGAAAWRPAFQAGVVAVIATRVREIVRRARGPAEAAGLYQALYAGWRRLEAVAGQIDLSAQSTKYYLIAAQFLETMQRTDLSGEAKAGAITADVESIMARSWSCVDLHHSVFLAPDQIRTCCKRFFVDGVMQGDVALMDVPENGAAAVSADSILAAKRELHAAINRGDKTACSGCPFLEFKDWGPLDKLQLNYLSMEQHSRCNLKCTYCSETYYGGVAPRYDVRSLVDQLIDDESLAPDGTVVWGGGEPAMDRNFIPVITRLAERLPGLTQRVLTNSVARSATVEKLLAEGRIVVTSSVDAGTEETYDRVRGKPRLASTITTLKKYAAAGAARITIKYIFTEGNESAAEVRAFAALVEEAGLMGCNYQISADFKKETVTRTALASMILLYGLLIEAGAKVVFFDDLLRHRLIGMASEEEAAIRAMLADLGAPPTLADIDEHAAIAIWGAGWQAKYLLERASFFKKVKVAFFVDSTPAKIGTQFLGIDVRDPAELLGSDIPVLIAAVQGYPLIYGQYKKLGVADSRLIRGLVI